MTVRTINASDFYRHPGGELERVARDREPLVVLRRGEPLVRIVPLDREGNVVSNGGERTVLMEVPFPTDDEDTTKDNGGGEP